MSSKQYQILNIAKTLDEAHVILKQHNVSKYEAYDKTRLQLLGKRHGKGRSKKVQTALLS